MVIDDCKEGDYIVLAHKRDPEIMTVSGDGVLGLMAVGTRYGTEYLFYDNDPTRIELVLPAPPVPEIKDVRPYKPSNP